MASSNCVVCDNPAPNKCGGCKTRTYCSKECQVNDWPKHKATCKDVLLSQALERAAAITQQAYLNFRENTWDTPIDRIEDNADALVTHDGEAPNRLAYFVDFPNKLMPNDRAKMAVLTMLACDEPLAWMHNLFDKLTKGLHIKIEEVKASLRWIPRKTTAVHPSGYRQDNWPKYFHSLLQVTSTKTKTQWIVDIGGGQYGICTPFWPAADYVDRYISTDQPLKIYPHGTHRDILKILGKIEGNPSMIYGLTGDVARTIDEAATAFEKSNNFQLKTLVLLADQEELERQKLVLLGTIDIAVRGYIVKNKKAIAAKWRASQRYEKKHPGVSSSLNHKATHKLYAERLATSPGAPPGSYHYNVGGVHHVVL